MGWLLPIIPALGCSNRGSDVKGQLHVYWERRANLSYMRQIQTNHNITTTRPPPRRLCFSCVSTISFLFSLKMKNRGQQCLSAVSPLYYLFLLSQGLCKQGRPVPSLSLPVPIYGNFTFACCISTGLLTPESSPGPKGHNDTNN